MARLTATLTIVLALVAACATAAAVPYTSPLTPTAPTAASRGASQPAVIAPAFVPGQYTPFGLDQSPHAGFPLATRLPDGQVRVMWRESSGHLALDGRTLTAVGNPLTGVWSTPTEVVLPGLPVDADQRPGALSVIDGMAYLTYFYTLPGNSNPAGVYLASSADGGETWGQPVRVDGGRPYAAVSGPAVKIGNRLVVTWYGRNAGEAVDTTWASTSLNDGATWTQLRLTNGLGSGRATNEPWSLVRGSTLMVLYRDGGWDGLALRISLDGGATWPTQPRRILDQATANSASVWASNGNIYVVYRHTLTRDAMLAISRDSGATWQTVATLMRTPANVGAGSLGMTYAAPVELGDGQVWCPVGMEQSLDASRIYVGWL